MTDVSARPPRGASAWEQDLWLYLTNHVASERKLLEEYQSVAESTKSKALGYLVRLLIEDEIRHHRMFQDLAESLTTFAELGGDEPAIPYLDFDKDGRSEAIDVTNRLLEKEKEDAAELKRLQRELRDVKETTLWSLLVDVMQRDTEKHIALLTFARKHVGK